MNYGKSQFEIAKESQKDEFLIEQGIEDTSLAKSLGVFAFSIGLILLLFLIYFITKKCGSFCQKIRVKIANKMFYSGPLRYVIVGFIKLLSRFLAFFLFGIMNDEHVMVLVFFALVLISLVLWPIWSAFFLLRN